MVDVYEVVNTKGHLLPSLPVKPQAFQHSHVLSHSLKKKVQIFWVVNRLIRSLVYTIISNLQLFEESQFGEIFTSSDQIEELTISLGGAKIKVDCCCLKINSSLKNAIAAHFYIVILHLAVTLCI